MSSAAASNGNAGAEDGPGSMRSASDGDDAVGADDDESADDRDEDDESAVAWADTNGDGGGVDVVAALGGSDESAFGGGDTGSVVVDPAVGAVDESASGGDDVPMAVVVVDVSACADCVGGDKPASGDVDGRFVGSVDESSLVAAVAGDADGDDDETVSGGDVYDVYAGAAAAAAAADDDDESAARGWVVLIGLRQWHLSASSPVRTGDAGAGACRYRRRSVLVMLKHWMSLSATGVSRRSRVCSFLKPKRVETLPYGTQSRIVTQPRRLRWRRCSSLLNTIRLWVWNHGQYSKRMVCRLAMCVSMRVKKVRVSSGKRACTCRMANDSSVAG